MSVAPQPSCPFGPGVRAAISQHGVDEADLTAVAEDRGVSLLMPRSASTSVAVLHQDAPEPTALLDEADRLLWLAGREPAPELLASSRADDGSEAVVLSLGRDASTAELGHPMGPEALMQALAAALRTLHGEPTTHCPFSAERHVLRRIVDTRIAEGLVVDPTEGPYAGRSAAGLAAIFDDLMVELGEPDDPVFVHGALTPSRIWLDPSGTVTFLGWQWAGVGDRHVDLAAAASLLTHLYGPALVGPFFEAYGLEHVDIRRLDAYQLLAHLRA